MQLLWYIIVPYLSTFLPYGKTSAGFGDSDISVRFALLRPVLSSALFNHEDLVSLGFC